MHIGQQDILFAVDESTMTMGNCDFEGDSQVVWHRVNTDNTSQQNPNRESVIPSQQLSDTFDFKRKRPNQSIDLQKSLDVSDMGHEEASCHDRPPSTSVCALNDQFRRCTALISKATDSFAQLAPQHPLYRPR